MALLTAGWPLLSMSVSNHQVLLAHTKLTIGPGNGNAARFTVGPGWSLVPSKTDPRLDYSFRRGHVGMTVSYVALNSRARPVQLWPGFRNVLRLTYPGTKLGQPAVIPMAPDRLGAIGSLSGNREHGFGTIFTSKSRNFAVEMIVLAPGQMPHVSMLSAYLVVHSVMMTPRTIRQ